MKKLTAKIFGTLTLAAFLAACGGGGAGSSFDTGTGGGGVGNLSYIMSWNAPETTIDDEDISPIEEIEYYELYLNTNGYFSDEDAPKAFIAAVKNNKLVTDFDLALLDQNELPDSKHLYVSLKAVGIDGQKSAFMESIYWNRL